jgi:hypothetical protein
VPASPQSSPVATAIRAPPPTLATDTRPHPRNASQSSFHRNRAQWLCPTQLHAALWLLPRIRPLPTSRTAIDAARGDAPKREEATMRAKVYSTHLPSYFSRLLPHLLDPCGISPCWCSRRWPRSRSGRVGGGGGTNDSHRHGHRRRLIGLPLLHRCGNDRNQVMGTGLSRPCGSNDWNTSP